MTVKSGFIWFLAVLIVLVIVSIVNQNLSGALTFNSIISGQAEALLFNDISYDLTASVPYQYQYYVQKGVEYLVFALFLFILIYPAYKLFSSND